jgi:hypothetical protein
VPVWHEKLKSTVAEDRIALIGVIQEQHAERCRLFAQWQGIDWPILHDPINVLEPLAVPIFVAIDEHGVVRNTRPTPEWVLGTFLQTRYPAPAETAAAEPTRVPDLGELETAARNQNDAATWRELGNALILWGGIDRIDEAVAAYQRSAVADDSSAESHFRLGVAYRMRFDSPHRQADDFQNAVVEWGRALDVDPNHYIYRRRIQQYGPRLIKPYPFYDWVDHARTEIRSRGETPLELSVEPSGAEIAQPAKTLETAGADVKEPDPEGRIHRDTNRLITISSATVPARIAAGEAVRLHLEFRPSKETHWNNEADPPQIWITAPDGATIERPLFELRQPESAESRETRRLEFEVLTSSAAAGQLLRGYALYYVCEEAGGQCLYFRQDFEIPITVVESRAASPR